MRGIRHVTVGGVRAAVASRAELTAYVVEDCLKRRGSDGPARLLFDTNGHAISLAARDADYARALDAADVIHADGGWILPASRLLTSGAVPERSATTDLIHDIASAGTPHGLRHYLLGCSEEVNAACAARLAELHPGMVICGRHHGYFDDEAAVVKAVRAAAPDVVWIGLGKPREQLFAVRNRERLGAFWAITCGGCFNYVTGHYARAPKWMQRAHLEWLFRAGTDPKLLWRYATTSPHALWLALVRSR
ncbi:MAG TPA: WecB/TagA/CpsF family glycosyltransferase [Sphingomicrobium sp.]|jgi:exopolysaccharide biosynthesis WecB/TagA/CpsF family protein|nr:WecB/TagA/CpsF family glycosyltransferase [Sphingomicrobium sp.]